MITEDYVSFETAKLLKDKGFDWDWSPFYSKQDKDEWEQNNSYTIANPNYDVTLPFDSETLNVVVPHVSLQMVMKWLREKGIYVCPKLCCFCGSKKNDIPYYLWEPRIIRLPSNNIIYPQPLDMCKHYENYEEAVEAALKYSLENLI
jgi:hypothetical protein